MQTGRTRFNENLYFSCKTLNLPPSYTNLLTNSGLFTKINVINDFSSQLNLV